MKQLIQCMGMLMLLFGLSSRVSAQITPVSYTHLRAHET